MMSERPPSFSTWSTALVVKGLLAFNSRWFRLCREGVVCFFVGVCLLFSRTFWAPSEDKSTVGHDYACASFPVPHSFEYTKQGGYSNTLFCEVERKKTVCTQMLPTEGQRFHRK